MHHYALILAAGAASRMGRCKALLPLPFPDGDCCALERLARMYAFCGQRFVVTGHHAGLLEPVAPGWGLRAVRNPRPEDGMFSSICAGLQAVLEQARADGVEPEQGGVFVHPVDVPLTRRLTLLALLRTADAVPGTALQAAFCGEPGHPVYLPLSLVPAILAHDGREGLRGALAAVPCRQVPVADAAMLLDMDTPEQYADLQDRAACHDALTRDEAEGLLLQAGVPERGLRHALAVGRVAEALCAALAEARGEEAPVETALALASGLTHDICKGVHGHEAAGGRLLARLGLARMAAIVAAHRDQSVPAEKKLGAHELVYLADKYCRGGIWVPVAQRFAQKLEEFGADPGARAGIEGRRDRALALERRLAVELGRDPAQLAREVLDTADIGTCAQMLDARRALWTPLCPLGEDA